MEVSYSFMAAEGHLVKIPNFNCIVGNARIAI